MQYTCDHPYNKTIIHNIIVPCTTTTRLWHWEIVNQFYLSVCQLFFKTTDRLPVWQGTIKTDSQSPQL